MIDETGTTVSSTLLPKPPSSAAAVSPAGNLMTWWTGDTVMVFDASSLHYRYTIAAGETTAPLGPGDDDGRASCSCRSPTAIGVYDPVNGANERYIPLNAPARATRTPVVPAVSGSRVLEQRGDTAGGPGLTPGARRPRRRTSPAVLPDFQCLSSACASSR